MFRSQCWYTCEYTNPVSTLQHQLKRGKTSSSPFIDRVLDKMVGRCASIIWCRMSEQREKDGRRVLGNREGFRMVEGGCVLEGSKHDDESKHAHTHGVPRGILKYFQAHHENI